MLLPNLVKGDLNFIKINLNTQKAYISSDYVWNVRVWKTLSLYFHEKSKGHQTEKIYLIHIEVLAAKKVFNKPQGYIVLFANDMIENYKKNIESINAINRLG